MTEPEPGEYTAVLRNGRKAVYYIKTLPPPDAEQDYISVIVPAGDGDSAQELQRRGFRFVERSIGIEIPLHKFRPPLAFGGKFCFSVEEDWDPEEIFSIAKDSFETDCRFALDKEQKDRDLKDELLYGFISDLRGRRAVATCMYSGGRMQGFNLWILKEDSARVMLGAVAERYRGTGIALSLYSQTILAIRERERERERERRRVSSPA